MGTQFLKWTGGMPPIAWAAWLTDTHERFWQPDVHVLAKHAAWISANRSARNIQAVLHAGDFVSSYQSPDEWAAVVASGFPIAGIPSIWCGGNHDSNTMLTRDYTLMRAALPVSGLGGLAGTYQVDCSENNFCLITIGGRQWLVIGLAFDPSDDIVAWADGILAAHAAIPAIVLTHSDLYRDGTLTDPTASPPQEYISTGLSGGDNYGAQMWAKSFANRGNVALVLSGHDIRGRSAYLTTPHPAGSMFPECHHLMRNFQECSLQPSLINHDQIMGNPLLVLLGFDYANGWLYAESLSPPGLEDIFYTPCCMRARMAF